MSSGEISLIIGSMYSGKSSELLRRLSRFEIAKKKCLLIKHSCDTRYNNHQFVATHDNKTQMALPMAKLSDAAKVATEYDVIGIDEGQFFDELVEFCEYCANMGKIVVVAALDGTFERKPFQQVVDLIPRAENVTKLKAICQICFKEASFSKRITNETATVVVGSSDKYIAVCRGCFQKPIMKQAPRVQTRTLEEESNDVDMLE